MGFEMGLVLTAVLALLFLKTSSVYCEMRVDCMSQPFISSQLCPTGPALLQAFPQLMVPNIKKPTVHPLENYIDIAPIVPSIGGLPGYVPGMLPMPPIIIDTSDTNDDWQNMLLLILAMKNRNDVGYDNGCCNCGNGCHNCCGGCGGSCNCNGWSNCCGCCNCGGNGCITYVPYPVPVPMPGGCYCGIGGGDSSGGEASDGGAPHEINLIIKTDSSN